MKLAGLPIGDYRQRLATTGIQLLTGPFSVRVRSRVSEFADLFRHFYGEFPVQTGPEIADFHVNLKGRGGVRRWWRPQVDHHHNRPDDRAAGQ